MTSHATARGGTGGPDETSVRRDVRGIPVITARNREEAAFELGRALGQDRFFQLDLFRRRATGRLAELFGPSAVDHDTAQRTLGIARAAHRHLTRLPAPQQALLESHAAGIEQGRAERSEPPAEFAVLGVEPEPWEPADCVAVGLLLAQMLAGDGTDLRMWDVMERALPSSVCAFLLPERGPYATEPDGTANAAAPVPPPEELVALLRSAPPAPGGTPVVGADESPFGSNAFAVAGHRTAHGGALLAGDMHLPLTAPALLYRVSLRYPPHRIEGVVVPGVPVVVAGASERLAWSPTRLTAAHTDLVELPAPDTAEGSAGPYRVRTETVRVRGGDPVEVAVRESPWGPVYSRHNGADVALRWRPLEDGGFDIGLLDVAESGDVTAACDAANRAAGPPLNLVVADADGRIGWTVTGSLPRRNGPVRLVRPQRGERSWEGTVPHEDLPRLVDPASGILVMANQLTDRHGDPGRLAANGFSARRARRAAEVLSARAGLTVTDLLALQLDTDASFFAFYRDLVHEAVPSDETAPVLAEARAAVDLWDGTAATDARGLGVLTLFRENLRETLFAAVLRPCRELDPHFRYVWHDHEEALRSLLTAPDGRCVPAPYASRHAFLRSHLELAVRLHEHASGGRPAAEVRWGDLNRSAVHHPLSSAAPEAAALFDLPDVPLPGCAESVNAAHPGFGPAVRLIAGPGRLQDAVLQLPGGQSGDPRSVHYRDQFADWLRGVAAPLAAQPAPPASAEAPSQQEAAP